MPARRKLPSLLMGLVLVGSTLFTQVASAWDGALTGVIANIDVTNGSNLGLRISFVGGPTMCNGGPGWAYLNDTDSNYKMYAAALMLAKAQGTKVTVYTILEGPYCHIGYISVQPN